MITISVLAYNGKPLPQPLVADFDEMGGNIGRGEGNTLVLPDPERHISRTHAAIVFRAGAYAVRDQGTATPVYVNGQPLGNGREVPIVDGDEIRIGGYTLQVGVTTEVNAQNPLAPSAAAPAKEDVLGMFSGPAAGGAGPFADLLAPAPQKPSPARGAAKPAEEPFGAPAPAGGGAAPGAIPADFDAFADLAPPAAQPAEARLPDDFDLGLGPSSPANQSIDQLFGLGPGASPDVLAPGSPLAQAPGSAEGGPNVDPLAAFGAAPNVKPSPAYTQRDDTPELHGSFRIPEARPEAAPQRPAPPAAPRGAPVAPAPGPSQPTAGERRDDMVLSWESPESGSEAGAIRTMIVRPPGDKRPMTRDAEARGGAPSVDPLALFGAGPAAAGADRLGINAPPVTPQAARPEVSSAATPSRVEAARPAAGRPSPEQFAPVPAGATALSPAQQDELLRAFLAGAGVPDLKMPSGLTPQLMNMFGRLLREATQGTLDLLLARALTKREVHAEVTMIVARENNPLKFSPNVEVALSHLLAPQGRGFMTPLRAMKDAYNDLRSHQLGFMAGMRAALAGVLERFDPQHLEKRLSQKSVMDSLLPMNRRAKLWDLFSELYGDISKEAEDDFHALFGREFLRAYEEQVAKLEREDKDASRP